MSCRYFGFVGMPNASRAGLGPIDIFNNQGAHSAFMAQFRCYNCV